MKLLLDATGGLSLAALTMPIRTIDTLIAVAAILLGLAQFLRLIHSGPAQRGSSRIWAATSSLAWFIGGSCLIVIVWRKASGPADSLSSPYPEMGILMFVGAVLWLGYAFLRFWRPHAK